MAGTVALIGPNGTISLIDGVNYSIDKAWTPAVAGVRRSLLGGYGAYSDVVEEIPINVLGATSGSVYLNISKLERSIEDSQRAATFQSNIDEGAAIFSYQPQGSTVGAELQARILGYADPDQPHAVELSEAFDDVGVVRFTTVKLRFKRRGLWISGVTSSGISSVGTNPTVMTSDFGTLFGGGITPANSPINFRLNFGTASSSSTLTSGSLPPGYLAVATGANPTECIQIIEAEGMTATGYTAVNGTIANARGGSVLRYTPTGTTAVTSGTATLGTVTITSFAASEVVPVTTLMAVRNNSTSTSFSIKATYLRIAGSGTLYSASTPYYTVATSSGTLPQIIALEPTSMHIYCNRIQVTVQATSASGSLDIDYVAAIVTPNETTALIQHGTANVQSGTTPTLLISPAKQDRYEPAFGLETSFTGNVTGTVSVGYRGDIQISAASNSGSIAAAWFATSGTNFRYLNPSGTPAVTTFNATRYNGYLTPQ